MAHQDARKREVRAVRKKALFIGIPAEGLGRPYRPSAKTRFVGKQGKVHKQAAPLQAEASNPVRKSWADLADEEELGRSSQPDAERHGK